MWMAFFMTPNKKNRLHIWGRFSFEEKIEGGNNDYSFGHDTPVFRRRFHFNKKKRNPCAQCIFDNQTGFDFIKFKTKPTTV